VSAWLVALAGASLGAGAGAWLGRSQLLCADGTCPMTGTWQGMALLGTVFGWYLAVAAWDQVHYSASDGETAVHHREGP